MEGLAFYANQILEAARHIERNGAAFYRDAAGSLTDPRSAALMRELAEMEEDHERVFEAMQQELGRSECAPVSGSTESALDFLCSMARKYVLDPERQPQGLFEPGTDPMSVIDFAIEREKDSVIFYEGIRTMTPLDAGRNRLDQIVAQEMGHIMTLSRQAERIKRDEAGEQE